MWVILVIAIGGALGATCRYGVAHFVHERLGTGFPYGILTVNILGSFLMGLLAILLIKHLHVGSLWRDAILVGFLGAFTTFSSFSLDTILLLQLGQVAKALSYVLLSMVVCLLATGAGMWLSGRFL